MPSWFNANPTILDIMSAGSSRESYDSRKSVVLLRCAKCNTVEDTYTGDTKDVVEKYTVCSRCQQKLNGAKLASNPRDLGIS